MKRLGIVGGGIAGLGAAYYLKDDWDITLFEKDVHVGGHANTVIVAEQGQPVPIDTGFMVFNHATYPNLLTLFNKLEVPTKKTDMSFSVQLLDRKLEFSGASLNRLFGDRKNLFDVNFWRMLRQIDRFNKEGRSALSDPQLHSMTLAQYVEARGYGTDFLRGYIVPMSSAVWSTPPHKMLNFPAATLLRFFSNHGLLGVESQHQWWTVHGGSQEYVRRLLQHIKIKASSQSPVSRVERNSHGVEVITTNGSHHHFDAVVMACHADQALELLHRPTALEQTLLQSFCYQQNETVLHTDGSLMPKSRHCWASWNYRLDDVGASTTYWMNSLQEVSRRTNYFVTLNGRHLINPSTILKEMTYHHPIFDQAAVGAQSLLPRLNDQRNNTFFCGSYFGYGFHEDALTSALRMSEQLRRTAVCS